MTDETLRADLERAQRARLLDDLDRCRHGRHRGDVCYSCDGMSSGNLILPVGMVIGHTVHGHEIVIPPYEDWHDSRKWVRKAA